MKENHYLQPGFSLPQVARGKQCQSTPPWRRRLLAFLLLVMTLVVPRQAYAGAHFGKDYGSSSDYNSRINHHPTVNEPWIGIFLWFYDEKGSDGFFLHDETEKGHPGPAIYGSADFSGWWQWIIMNKVVPLPYGTDQATTCHPSGCAYRQLRCCKL